MLWQFYEFTRIYEDFIDPPLIIENLSFLIELSDYFEEFFFNLSLIFIATFLLISKGVSTVQALTHESLQNVRSWFLIFLEISQLQSDEELEYLKPMLEKSLGMLTNQNNDTDILLNQVSDCVDSSCIVKHLKPALLLGVQEESRFSSRQTGNRPSDIWRLSQAQDYADWKIAVPFRDEQGNIFEAQARVRLSEGLKVGKALRPNVSFKLILKPPNYKIFLSRLRFLVESGIVKHRLNFGLPKAEICPQNLGSIERQLRLTDLFTTYLTMLVGFSSALVVFLIEVRTRSGFTWTIFTDDSFPDDVQVYEC